MNTAANKVKSTKTQVFSKIEHGLELISSGLSTIMSVDGLVDLEGPKFVDACARLNSQSLAIEKLLAPAKDQIKQEALESGLEFVKGIAYQARVLVIPTTRLDQAKVKAFLGSKLYQFQNTSDETRISFVIKE